MNISEAEPQFAKLQLSYDAPLPKQFCPRDWNYSEFATREGAVIAADYWEDLGYEEISQWLRLWSELAPDDLENVPRGTSISAPGGSGRNAKFAKRLRSRRERMAARQNPMVENAYGHRGIW
jgi:hypothetical protein